MLIDTISSRRKKSDSELKKQYPNAIAGDYVINKIIKSLNSPRKENFLILEFNGYRWFIKEKKQ